MAAIASNTFRPLGTTTCNTRRHITYSWLLSSIRNSDLQHMTTHNLQLATCPLGIQTCITRQYINYSWFLSFIRNSDLQHTTTHNLHLATCPLGIQTRITQQYINYSWLLSSVRTHGPATRASLAAVSSTDLLLYRSSGTRPATCTRRHLAARCSKQRTNLI